MTDTTYGRAVIAGASIGGLLAARVLSDHFAEVILIERDTLPEGPQPRKGVPQGYHLHTLLTRGREIMDELFPGFTDDHVAHGVPLICTTEDAKILGRLGWFPRFPSPLRSLQASRELLEWSVHIRVVALPNVTIRTGTSVERLLATDDGARVTGVEIREEGGGLEELTADLVIDSTGRGSAAPRWLQQLGYDRPRETIVNAHLAYSSRFIQLEDGWRPDWRAIAVTPVATGAGNRRTRGCGLMEQEDGRWILCAFGNDGDHPPTVEDGLAAFIATLPIDDISEAVTHATPRSPIAFSRATLNRIRHFEELDRRPEGFIATADAVMCLNPVPGQGMTVAALDALVLRDELEEQAALHPNGDLAGLPERFQRRVAESNAFPWAMAAGADLRVRGVNAAPAPPEAEAARAFVDRLEALATEDTEVFLKLVETRHMVRTGEWMQEPELRARIVDDWDRLGKLVGAPESSPPA